MSSPTATSPQPSLSTHLSFPRKRPASFSNGPQNSSQRRNLSISTTSSHPLRQTSFPPNEQIAPARPPSFSPGVEDFTGRSGSVTNSSVGGSERKRRGRRRKNIDIAITSDGISNGIRNSVHRALGNGIDDGIELRDDEDGDDDGDGGLDTLLQDGGQMDEAAIKQEKEHLALLMSAFSYDQAHRYDIWRRVRLRKEIVRKITNQTLSQSVPASIITTINGYTKVFIGEIIERAKDVQSEWTLASARQLDNEHMPTQDRSWNFDTANPRGGTDATLKLQSETFKGVVRSTAEALMETDRGPLTPAHLREALRRYKKDKAGGGVGFHGISLEGTDRRPSGYVGKRVFR